MMSYSSLQISTSSFANQKSAPVRVLSLHFAVIKMQIAIRTETFAQKL